MSHQLKPSTFFSLLFWIVLYCTGFVISASKSSDLGTVFSKAIGPTTLDELLGGSFINSSLTSACYDANGHYNNLESCLKTQCIGAAGVAQLYNLSLNTPLDEGVVREVAPAVLYTLKQKDSCLSSVADNTTLNQRPSSSAVWGYSFLFVTLINLCSLTGILVLPCMKSALYKVILMFMVALAVGTLVGSGVLVLIPEAFELTHVGGGGAEEGSSNYIWTATSVIGGIYLFFLIERFMRMINVWRENTRDKKRRDDIATRGTVTSSFTRHTPHNASLKLKDPANIHLEESPSSACLCNVEVSQGQGSPEKNSSDSSQGAAHNGDAEEDVQQKGDDGNSRGALIQGKKSALNGHSHHGHSHKHNGQVAPVAYMVIFGDGLHNFIDGLSIGAAFTESVLLGISVSVAVMCEELPHELGDFAILLNAGMRLRKALMYNFLSSLMCYLGLIIGILVGENTTAHTWIFGVAGGMFLYISLVDMLPEMNSTAETEDGKQFGMVKTFLIQNIGLLCGYSIMLLMAVYGGEISFE